MRIKVIIENGIVQDVLTDATTAPDVEIIDVDKDYEDYEKLEAYRDKQYKDATLHSCEYSVARFDED